MTRELAALLAILGAALVSMPVFALGRTRRAPDEHEVADRGSFVLGGFLRSWFFWFQIDSGAAPGAVTFTAVSPFEGM